MGLVCIENQTIPCLVVNQPTFSYGHHVSLAGGYSTFFDTATNLWDAEGKKEFAALSDREDAEELLFTFRAQIYVLLYSHFGGLQLFSLYKFDEKQRTWEKFADLEVRTYPGCTGVRFPTSGRLMLRFGGFFLLKSA